MSVGDSDIEAEFVKLAGKASAFGPIEVVGAEIDIVDPALEHPVNSREDGGGDSHDCLTGTASGLEPVEQRPEIAAPGSDRTPGDLDEHGLEPGSPLAELCGPALDGTLVISGIQAGPRDEMGSAREALHVDANLSEDHGGRQLTDAGNGHQPHGGPAKRLEALADLGVDPRDGGLDRGDLGKMDLQEQTLVVGQATAQGFGDLGARGSDPSPVRAPASKVLSLVACLTFPAACFVPLNWTKETVIPRL